MFDDLTSGPIRAIMGVYLDTQEFNHSESGNGDAPLQISVQKVVDYLRAMLLTHHVVAYGTPEDEARRHSAMFLGDCVTHADEVAARDEGTTAEYQRVGRMLREELRERAHDEPGVSLVA
jgi:hypothetical protein